MKTFGTLYSAYYDLVYADKNYQEEVDYLEFLFQEYCNPVETVLDLGCGTGAHAGKLSDSGYVVHGIDTSEAMLEKAELRRKGREESLKFTKSSIQNLNLDQKFDVVTSLFHVMSYQTTNDQLIRAFEVAKMHLKKGGLFIFDFWYGPAVLTDLPVTRIKRLENKNVRLTRIAEPVLKACSNTVDVNFDIYIQELKTREIKNINEVHQMRYFFDTELELIAQEVGFSIRNRYAWLEKSKPDFSSWNVVWVLQK